MCSTTPAQKQFPTTGTSVPAPTTAICTTTNIPTTADIPTTNLPNNLCRATVRPARGRKRWKKPQQRTGQGVAREGRQRVQPVPRGPATAVPNATPAGVPRHTPTTVPGTAAKPQQCRTRWHGILHTPAVEPCEMAQKLVLLLVVWLRCRPRITELPVPSTGTCTPCNEE